MSSTNPIKNLLDKSKDYLETNVDIIKPKAIDKSAVMISDMIVLVASVMLGFLILVLISVGAALLIGAALETTYYGFLLMSGFYALLLWLIFVQRYRWIKIPVTNGIIQKMTN